MIRFPLRFFGLLLLAAAFAALVVDGTRAIAADSWSFNSIYTTLRVFGPEAVPKLLARLPAAWQGTAEATMRQSPTCVVFAVMGLLMFAMTVRPGEARRDRPGWSS